MFLHQIIRGSRQHFLETKKIRREILLTSVDGPQHVSQLMLLFSTREQQPGPEVTRTHNQEKLHRSRNGVRAESLHGAC